ncbi:MAG: hypothetical protein HQL41_02265 [Alphaproteobacteria bacterium]|nr:hypothetical protein [Alphaproteobacteria bacterium]
MNPITKGLDMPQVGVEVIVNPDEDPPLGEDMEIQDFARVMAARMRARGLTADDIAETLEMSEEERRNVLGR